MRKFLGVFAGIVVAMLVITLVERIGHSLYPPPIGADMSTPQGVTNYIAATPFAAKACVVFGWFAGAALGGWAALRLSRWPRGALIVAALIAAAGIFNATQIAAPLWMQLATVIAPALGGWAARHLPARRDRI